MIHCRKCGAEVCRVDVEDVYREAMALVRHTHCSPGAAVKTALECVLELERQMSAREEDETLVVSTMGNQQPPQVTL